MHANHEHSTVSKTSKLSDRFSDESTTVSSDTDSYGGKESWRSSQSSSCSSCSESGSEESSVEWESEVGFSGELYYILSDPSYRTKCSSDTNINSTKGTVDGSASPTREQSKSWRNGGKLVRLIRRRESKRHQNKSEKISNFTIPQSSEEVQPTSFHDSIPQTTKEDIDLHTVEINVDPWVKPNLGRRATISETLLGLVTTNYDSAIVVTDFVPDGLAAKNPILKIGDRICFINGRLVTVQNFNSLLASINAPTSLLLSICPASKISKEKRFNTDHSIPKVYQSPLAEKISKQSSFSNEVEQVLLQSCFGALFLRLDGLTEDGPEDQGVVYCFPGNIKTNTLGLVRGTFLTLFQLIPDVSNTIPISSSIFVRDQLVHVAYTQEGRELLLIAVPSSRCTLSEALKHSGELVHFLKFSYQSLSRCFSSFDHHAAVNNLMSKFFCRLLGAEKWVEIIDTASIENFGSKVPPFHPQFELLLPAAHLVPLPREAQMQIDDALSEFESNDIGDSCEDLDCQRLYTILGSCLYHKGYLLASHFTHADLLDIHTFCRQHGLIQLIQSEPVKSLVIWREVYPSSVLRGLKTTLNNQFSTYQTPEGRWFIMIVGQKQDMLVTLLEAGGCSMNSNGNPSPDIFYVEAAQDTLQHLIKIGISDIASEWLESQLRPKTTTPEIVVASKVSSRKVNNLLGLRVPHDPGWQSSLSSILSSPSARKSSDSMSFGKRKPSPDHSSSGPLHGETSEDSASLVASLPSDDTGFMPYKGRGERDSSTHISPSDHEPSEESDSDWDESEAQTGQRPTSTSNLSDFHSSLLKNVEGTVPSKLTMGAENLVFHFVHIDTSEGVLLSPIHPQVSPSFNHILYKFRQTAMHIHTLFQNTISFKLKGSETSPSLINKSLVAIKEFGALFECNVQSRGNDKMATQFTYWVVGRLFFMPASREVYVCYEDSAPQNLVEIAFRLALSTNG